MAIEMGADEFEGYVNEYSSYGSSVAPYSSAEAGQQNWRHHQNKEWDYR